MVRAAPHPEQAGIEKRALVLTPGANRLESWPRRLESWRGRNQERFDPSKVKSKIPFWPCQISSDLN
jgi:hypothetical protein